MKTFWFVVGFLGAMALSVERIAASDPEPIGTGASLYLLGLLLSVICATTFTLSAERRLVPYSSIMGLCVGSLSSAVFYSAVAFVFPALSFGAVALAGSTASVLVSWVAPRFFRPLPNNSFKPKPLRGSA